MNKNLSNNDMKIEMLFSYLIVTLIDNNKTEYTVLF